MSLAKTQSAAAKTPASERLQRLAVDAGAYLGKDAGDTIPVKEVRLQAEANGYKHPALLKSLRTDRIGVRDTERESVAQFKRPQRTREPYRSTAG